MWATQDALGTRVFRATLALYIAVCVARIQEVVPGLTYFYLGKLAIVPMLVATLVALPRWQLLSVLRTRPGKCMAAIVALCLLSIPLSIWPANSAHFFVFIFVPELVLFMGTSAGFADPRTARLCIVVLVACVGLDALYVNSGLSPWVRGRAYIGAGLDPNESAALFVCVLPLAIMVAAQRAHTRWIALVAAPACVIALSKTASRGGLVGLLVVATVLVIQYLGKRRWMHVVAIIVGAGAFAVGASDALVQRFATMLEPESDYNYNDREGRIEVWKRGLGYMATHPVLGVGLASFETAEGTLGAKANEGYGVKFTAAHNSFVQIGAELGVFGLAAFITAIWSSAAACRRARRLASAQARGDPRLAQQQSDLASALLCAIAAITSTGFFLSFAYHPIIIFTIGACAGLAARSLRMSQSAVR